MAKDKVIYGMDGKPIQTSKSEEKEKKGFFAKNAATKFKKKAESGKLRKFIQTPFEKGQSKMQEILGEDGLRTQEMKDVMEMRKKQAEEGISPAEQEAMKSKMAKQMMAAEQQAGLKMGSALGGMRGAGAAAQARSLQAQGLQARAGIERDIFMAQEQAKREGLDKLEATTQFDVGQIGKEKAMEAAGGLAFEQIQASKEGAALTADALRRQGGGKK